MTRTPGFHGHITSPVLASARTPLCQAAAFPRPFDERLPRGVGRPHVLGSSLLGVLGLMALTGVLLALGYAASTASARENVRVIDQDPWGRLIRGLHHWGASAAIVMACLHLARVFFYAAYRPPRQWTWVAGLGLLLVLLSRRCRAP